MLHPVSSLAGLGAGCSAMSWETEDRRHLWGRNLDFNMVLHGIGVFWLSLALL